MVRVLTAWQFLPPERATHSPSVGLHPGYPLSNIWYPMKHGYRVALWNIVHAYIFPLKVHEILRVLSCTLAVGQFIW